MGTTDVGQKARSIHLWFAILELLPLHLTCSLRIFTQNRFIPGPWLWAIRWYYLVLYCIIWYYLVLSGISYLVSKSGIKICSHTCSATACHQATLLAWLKVMLTRRSQRALLAKQVTWRDYFQTMSNISSRGRDFSWIMANKNEIFWDVLSDHGNLLTKVAAHHTYLPFTSSSWAHACGHIECAKSCHAIEWFMISNHKCQFMIWLTRQDIVEFQVWAKATMLLEATEHHGQCWWRYDVLNANLAQT